MAISEAQKKAKNKWDAENLEKISIRVKKGEKDVFKGFAEKAGLSLAKFIREACYEKAGEKMPK